jgi:hypothetical protein
MSVLKIIREGNKLLMKQKNENKLIFVKNKEKSIRKSETEVKLKCFYVNARSLINKREEVELYILDEKPDVVGFTETWATENIEDPELAIEGYTMFRKDRMVGVDGTTLRSIGVLLYIKNSINAVVREDCLDRNFPECMWCDIEVCGEKTLVGVCYRPPGSKRIQDEALSK